MTQCILVVTNVSEELVPFIFSGGIFILKMEAASSSETLITIFIFKGEITSVTTYKAT
jgi:hypothetical protein